MFSNSKMLNTIINHQNEIVSGFFLFKSNYSKFYLIEMIHVRIQCVNRHLNS